MQKFFLTLLISSASFCEIISNAPVNPMSCEKGWSLQLSGFYWTAHQDGMEFAICNNVAIPIINPFPSEIQEINNLIDDDFHSPKSTGEFGFAFGIGYQSPYDGWDLEFIWTHFSPSSFTHAEAKMDNNQTLITLWSAFSPAQGEINYARDIEVVWKLNLNWVDLELGRAFWTSKKLSLRPFIGLRYAVIKQNYKLEHKGGSWSPRINPTQEPFSNEVKLNNNYRGIGLRSGLDGVWSLDCGWGFYNDLAVSIIYGHFDISHNERNRLIITPYRKTKILDSKANFRASRTIFDIAFGIQWSALFCDCHYKVTAKLGWQQHLFLHQNQLWRVVRIGDMSNGTGGENVFHQQCGTLDTKGIALSVEFTY